jgi:hypothetical protein
MKYIYVYITLGLGTVITVSISLACSYWFFYSLLGSQGLQSVAAGIAGCAIQLFGYGFAASFLPMNKLFRFGLCIVPLALSMLSTYSALYGYLLKEKMSQELSQKKDALVLGLLEQSSRDKQLAAAAAEQGLGESYRTQAKSFLEFNQASREKDLQLLMEMEEKQQQHLTSATPLDGLVEVTGSSVVATTIFCVWLAIMFDMLPLVAIATLSKREQHIKNKDADNSAPLPLVTSPPIDRDEVEATSPMEQTPPQHLPSFEAAITPQPTISSPPAINSQPTITPQPTEAEHPVAPEQNEYEQTAAIPAFSYEQVATELRLGNLQPNYKAVTDYAGWSKWKTQEFFKYCRLHGIVEKRGRGFKLTNKLAVVPSVRQSAKS